VGDFASCLAVVLVEEGGFSNNPHDPGGATMHGVTQRVYDAWRRQRQLPLASVRGISNSEVAAIYRAQYWDAVQGDRLPRGVDLMVFDEGVNSGPARSAKDLQGLLRGVHADGIIGELTLDALAQVNDLEGLVRALAARRLGFLRRLRNWKFFNKGWTARCHRVEEKALSWVAQAPVVAGNGVAGGGVDGRAGG